MADPKGRDLHRGLGDLASLAKSDLRKALAGARTPTHARAILADIVPSLIDTYGSAAATLAADWYDEVREQLEVKGAFRAIVPEPPDSGGRALLGWALDEATDLKTFETLLMGGYTRRILKYGRTTVSRSAVADPGADGWQRQGVGANCSFCNFLIGRGAVYGENSVDFASHDHCNCIAVVAFTSRTKPVLLDKDGKRLTQSTRASRTDPEQRAADNERIRDWIESHPESG